MAETSMQYKSMAAFFSWDGDKVWLFWSDILIWLLFFFFSETNYFLFFVCNYSVQCAFFQLMYYKSRLFENF